MRWLKNLMTPSTRPDASVLYVYPNEAIASALLAEPIANSPANPAGFAVIEAKLTPAGLERKIKEVIPEEPKARHWVEILKAHKGFLTDYYLEKNDAGLTKRLGLPPVIARVK